MTYQDIAGWSQIIAMSIFGTVMAGVLLYTFRPANRDKFEHASRAPLLREADDAPRAPPHYSLVREDDEFGEGSHGR